MAEPGQQHHLHPGLGTLARMPRGKGMEELNRVGFFGDVGWDVGDLNAGGWRNRGGMCWAVPCCAVPSRQDSVQPRMGMWGRVLPLPGSRMDGVARQLPGGGEAGTKRELPGPSFLHPSPNPSGSGAQQRPRGHLLCPPGRCHHPTPGLPQGRGLQGDGPGRRGLGGRRVCPAVVFTHWRVQRVQGGAGGSGPGQDECSKPRGCGAGESAPGKRHISPDRKSVV